MSIEEPGSNTQWAEGQWRISIIHVHIEAHIIQNEYQVELHMDRRSAARARHEILPNAHSESTVKLQL